MSTAAISEKKPPAVDIESFGQRSGFEGAEVRLGAAVAQAILAASSSRDARHDFRGRERELGLAIGTIIRTLNVRHPYQHEMNDALVKAHLTSIEFAKQQGLMAEFIDHELRVQAPIFARIRKIVEDTGNPDFALIALTERTACFYHLINDYQRVPGSVTWQSPWRNVLRRSNPTGQHTITDRDIHECWTVPRMKRQAELMGVNIEVSPWHEDGTITVRVIA